MKYLICIQIQCNIDVISRQMIQRRRDFQNMMKIMWGFVVLVYCKYWTNYCNKRNNWNIFILWNDSLLKETLMNFYNIFTLLTLTIFQCQDCPLIWFNFQYMLIVYCFRRSHSCKLTPTRGSHPSQSAITPHMPSPPQDPQTKIFTPHDPQTAKWCLTSLILVQ